MVPWGPGPRGMIPGRSEGAWGELVLGAGVRGGPDCVDRGAGRQWRGAGVKDVGRRVAVWPFQKWKRPGCVEIRMWGGGATAETQELEVTSWCGERMSDR